MDYGLVVFVFTGALVSGAVAQTRQYYFVNTPQNWTSAQNVCRHVYTDLATIESTADIQDVANTSLSYAGKAWIGLHDDLENSWRWSLDDSSFYGEGEATFRNWFSQQPNNAGGQQYCVELFSGSPHFGTWGDTECYMERRFVCYNGTVDGTASFVLVDTAMNWTDAQRFCRKNYVDLASIRNQTENDIIRAVAAGNFVWIGLYRQKVWSDGSHSLFRHWANNQPDSGDEQCVAAMFNESGRWSDERCSLSFPFICYATIPPNADGFRSTGQNETSITLQWNKVNFTDSFILQFDGTETNIAAPDEEGSGSGLLLPAFPEITFISAPDGDGPVTHTVSSLNAATKYTFTLFSVFENVRSSGLTLTAVTAPPNTKYFTSGLLMETSVTLLWYRVNNNVSFILQFNGTDTAISAPDGDLQLNYAVSSLTAGTEYTFTLFSVFENVRSSGVSVTVVPVPPNAEYVGAIGQNETSVTVQWNKLNDNINFILQFNGTETNIAAPDEDGLIIHTVSSLTAATKYTFTLFSVFENVRSSGVTRTAVTAPPNPEGFISIGQNETSVTLQWNKVNNNVNFILQVDTTETNVAAPDGDGSVTHTESSHTAGINNTSAVISVLVTSISTGATFPDTTINAPDGDGPVTHTVSSLTAGTEYTFTVLSVFENIRSSGVSITVIPAPPNAENVRSTGQNENSITLQWNKVSNNVNFVLQFDGTETNIAAPDGDGPVTYTVSSLTAATKYTFTLYSVFENVRSSGVTLTAVTAPPNPGSIRLASLNETSVILQWNKVNNNVNFIVQFNGIETNISAPDGDGPVTHTVSSLTAGTEYTFTVFSVFENIRSSGVNITVVPGPYHVVGLTVRLKSLVELSESNMEDVLTEFFRRHGLLPPVFLLKVKSVQSV